MGDGIVEKNLALPLADLYLTLATINVLLQKSCCLLQAKPLSSNERGWENMPDSFSSFPACTSTVFPTHTAFILPAQGKALVIALSSQRCFPLLSSHRGEQNQMVQ